MITNGERVFRNRDTGCYGIVKRMKIGIVVRRTKADWSRRSPLLDGQRRKPCGKFPPSLMCLECIGMLKAAKKNQKL